MARSGSEKRQRQHVHKARFDDREDALVREQAARFGVSVASLIRYAVLSLPPLRARRQPQVREQEIARLIGELGALKAALKLAAAKGATRECERHVEAACRDIADMCRAALMALGREP